MTLLERVSMLIRSNLNDLIDKAEDPEKMVKQVILDVEAELRELKGQVAVCIADQNMLERKCKEHRDKMAEWMHKAELSLDRTGRDAGAGRPGALRELPTAGRGNRKTGDRTKRGGGRPQVPARPAGTEAGGSALERRTADRPEPAFAGAR